MKIIITIISILIIFLTHNLYAANWEEFKFPLKNNNTIHEIRLKSDTNTGIEYLKIMCETKKSSSHAEYCMAQIAGSKKNYSRSVEILINAKDLKIKESYILDLVKESEFYEGKDKLYSYICENNKHKFYADNNPHISHQYRISAEFQGVMAISRAFSRGEPVKIIDNKRPEISGIFKSNNPNRFREFLMRFLKM